MLEHHAGLNNTKQASNRVMSLTLVLTMVLVSSPRPITMQTRISNKIMVEIIMKWISLEISIGKMVTKTLRDRPIIEKEASNYIFAKMAKFFSLASNL